MGGVIEKLPSTAKSSVTVVGKMYKSIRQKSFEY